ncbi:hypothetical protein [Fictibacillus barbaricus]|uniref:hypothetical protein n=1 Tax=Fictibacillus barbaricus TaxID=182136 RepID=UPI001664FE3B|nr:hypothetical protein [Fictibacillus barbaricus]GGB59184.1 hypothetical protein GCM10007199_26310 [Fictibacillus barbaricus]
MLLLFLCCVFVDLQVEVFADQGKILLNHVKMDENHVNSDFDHGKNELYHGFLTNNEKS